MRDLTEEELKLAPDWATHYYALASGVIQFESEEFYARASTVTCKVGATQCNKDYGVSGVPMPFDITNHEFSDPAWSINEVNSGQGYIDFYNHETCTDDGDAEIHALNKQDAIVIAKALGVTGDDLK